MQPPQDSLTRTTVVVLNEPVGDSRRGKYFGLKGFQKKSSFVPKNLWLDQNHIWNFSGMENHCPIIHDANQK